MKQTFQLIFSKHLLIALCIFTSALVNAANFIPLEQVTKDVSYLASDKLKGRGNFSPEISLAAKYITERFEESGLVSANNISTKDFLQTYKITKTTSDKLEVVINGKRIQPEHLTIASNAKELSWRMNDGIQSNAFTVHTITENDNFRTEMGKLNQTGGKHLVLLNPAHKTIFERYKNYFDQGLTKPASNNQIEQPSDTIIIVHTETTAKDLQSVEISAINTISTSELSNVIAILPGKTKPNEIVLFSAHYDHLGMKKAKNDAIYNGADDNASGVTAIINIAQYYAQQNNNDRTLMFAAFSAEEIGGFGSQYFSNQLDANKIIAMINVEMVGKPSKFGAGTLWMTGMERSNLGEKLNQTLAKSGKEIYKDPYPEQGLFYRSDNATLARLGVPAHSFSSTQLDKDEHYHQVSDDLSSLDLRSLQQVIQALTIATKPLVDGSMTPSRIDVNKVKHKGLIY